MSVKEELEEMKKEVHDVQEKSFALELLHDFKVQNKRIFIIWIITFVALIGVSVYTIYLLNDIGTETSTTITKTVDVDDVDNIENSTISNEAK